MQFEKRVDQLGAIDIVKLFFAICVCAGHCGIDNTLLTYTSSCCLSFFFIASGFLMSFKMEGFYGSPDNLLRIKNSTKQMIRRYIVWTVITLPIIVCNYIDTKVTVLETLVWFARDAVFRGEFGWGYMSTWYLLSSIYALLVIYLILKKSRTEKWFIVIIVVSAVLRYAIGLIPYEEQTLGDSLREGTILQYITFNTLGMYNARILFGLYAFPVGVMIAKIGFPSRIRYIPWILILPCIYVFRLEIIPYTIGQIILGSLCLWCCCSISIKSGFVCRACRRISAIMYFSHKIFIFIFERIFDLVNGTNLKGGNYTTMLYSFAIACTLCFGMTVHVMCEKRVCQKVTRLLL